MKSIGFIKLVQKLTKFTENYKLYAKYIIFYNFPIKELNLYNYVNNDFQ